MMTVDYVLARVAEVEEFSDDPETAHAREDDLYLDVLVAIAAGINNSKDLARAALKTGDIEFPRWCA